MTGNKQQDVNALQWDANMIVPGAAGDGLTWYAALADPFQVAGFAWLAADQTYRRLPVRPEYPVSDAVDSLANCTSGGQIRFRTNSRRVAVRVRLSGTPGMYHMPATGEGGVDAYIGLPGSMVYAGTARFPSGQDAYESEVYAGTDEELRQFTLNLPLYKGVKELWIGLEDGATVTGPIPYESPKRVIFYGTSITQGGCATRPGMSYTNLLSRRINLECINLGFSGNGKGEPELARLISAIADPACLVLDYEANCDTERYCRTLPEFISIYREAHPSVPLVVVSRIVHGGEVHRPELRKNRLERLHFQRELIRKLQEAGDTQLFFVDGSDLLGEEPAEATVDGVHPTDLGFLLMANGLEPVLRNVLSKGGL
ncbi:SGNH/GDSL hydrolase family protein [Paenibacillus sp. GD4]|uniref:SGNH/GDSL hydrolase family protein n=1 Tax=Paenibacillus sp. GD4 TaxID=3068890 RepID=UPI002796D62E|nr:SGNH/GDSL hydrolase family protein [Paenibacillus sp. GD4]MDQ1914925.1 SGNH/GDSL hydrolase family protein [Paenibacillus sp. GD4]